MDMVERACIAYNQILLNQPEDQRDQTLAMKAAIRAVLEGLELYRIKSQSTYHIYNLTDLFPTER